jgi:hypothetical protein
LTAANGHVTAANSVLTALLEGLLLLRLSAGRYEQSEEIGSNDKR